MPSLKLAVHIATIVAEEQKPENLGAAAQMLLAAHPEAEETPDMVAQVLRDELDAAGAGLTPG